MSFRFCLSFTNSEFVVSELVVGSGEQGVIQQLRGQEEEGGCQ
jgi:hypothetical protein